MTALWIGGFAFALLALLFLCYPFIKRSASQQIAGTGDSNVSLFEEHLDELVQQRERGEISSEQLDELKHELERTLLLEEGSSINASSRRVSPKIGLIWLLIVIVPLSAFALYRYLGASQDLEIIHLLAQVTELRANGDTEGANRLRGQLTKDIERRLEADSQNFYYWVIKARLASDQQNYTEALAAYRVALPLSPQDLTLLEEYLQVAFIVAGGKPTEEINALVERILTLSPDNLPVLGLSGRLAFEAGNYQQAILAWQQVLEMLPEGHQTTTVIEQELQSARQALIAAGGAGSESVSAAKIQVEVSLAEELTFAAGETLFVIAKRAGQPGPPLAVKRLSAAAFPLQISLTDQDLMLPGSSLKDAGKLQLVARLSRSGQALPQPGDRQGEAQGVSVEGSLVTKIEIIRVVE